MTRKLKPATELEVYFVDRAYDLVKDARALLRQAGCNAAAKKVAAVIKSVDGARRHMERRLKASQDD